MIEWGEPASCGLYSIDGRIAMENKGVYEQFYRCADGSAAYSGYCAEVYGIDLTQDGFADREQLDYLLTFLHLNGRDAGLDIGCGNGRMADYVTRRTGASMSGVDSSPVAIDWARRMVRDNPKLDFFSGDINRPDIPAGKYTIMTLVDSIYFSEDYSRTLGTLYDSLLPGGRIGIFYSDFILEGSGQKEPAGIDGTEVARVIAENGWSAKSVDFSDQHFELMKRKRAVGTKYRADFEAERNEALFRRIWDESIGENMSREEFGKFSNRYLYCVYKPNDR